MSRVIRKPPPSTCKKARSWASKLVNRLAATAVRCSGSTERRPRETWRALSTCWMRPSACMSGTPVPDVRPIEALKARV